MRDNFTPEFTNKNLLAGEPNNRTLKIYLLAPRGFCAGVERAVSTVEAALSKFGAPIYVKHQIVHNKNVIETLKNKGVVFTNDLSEVPEGGILIFNAHGVTQEFEEEVIRRNITFIDATCPLVKKVHREANKLINSNYELLIIGHADHPEVIATKSRSGANATVISNLKEAEAFEPRPDTEYAFVTQTTLSVDYIKEVTEGLQKKIPNLIVSKNICYATQNRQTAIKEVVKHIDALIIVGSKNSSNSNRLREIGDHHNICSYLIDSPKELPIEELRQFGSIAISAGASSPDYAISNILEAIKTNIESEVIPYEALEETVSFTLPSKVLDKPPRGQSRRERASRRPLVQQEGSGI